MQKKINIPRRRFIRGAAGLLIPTVFDIFVPKVKAQGYYFARPAAAGGGSCPADGAPSFEHAPAANADQHVSLNTDHYYGGQKGWSDSVERVICKLRFNIESVGTITGITYRAAVYTLSGNNLNTELGFGTITGGSWADANVIVDLSANPATIPASTLVAFVWSRNDNPNADASNYTKMNLRETTGTLAGNFCTWNTSKVLESNQTTMDTLMAGYWMT